MKNKKLLLFFIGILLIALGVLLFIQGTYLGKLDVQMQQEAYGFYKEDVSMLTYWQQWEKGLCNVGGFFIGFSGLALIAYGIFE